MGSRPISISFDKIYKIVKLCSLNGIFVAIRPLPVSHCIPQFASCYLRVCVCVCVRGCTLDKVYSFLGDNFVSFAVGKRETHTHTHTQATSSRASLANHPSMPQRLETKAGLCLPSKLRRRPRRRLRL